MATELCSYRLNLYGKAVGTHTLRTQQGKQGVRLEAQLALQGSLGQKTITQTSQLNSALESVRFTEETQERSETRTFEVIFDAGRGVVRASQSKSGKNDSAEVPYTLPYRDPLGLLYVLRDLPERLRLPLLGKNVVAERLAPIPLETALGERRAYPYVLYPGPNYLYVDAAPPHLILRFTQRFEGGLLDAFLMKVVQEDTSIREETRPPKRRRRRRRGRRGGDKNG